MPAEASKHHSIIERAVLFLICAPLSVGSGCLLYLVIVRGLSGASDWLSVLAMSLAAEFIGAIFLIFFFVSIWAVTGRDLFDQLAARYLRRFVLVSLAGLTVIVLYVALAN